MLKTDRSLPALHLSLPQLYLKRGLVSILNSRVPLLSHLLVLTLRLSLIGHSTVQRALSIIFSRCKLDLSIRGDFYHSVGAWHVRHGLQLG